MITNQQSNGKPPVALVTGASRGIGRAIARELALRGWLVVINYLRGEKQAAAVLTEIESLGGRGFLCQTDVTQADQVRHMFRVVKQQHGFVGVLVNNAGITRDEMFLMMKPPHWNSVIDLNLHATFHCCQAALRDMSVKRRGVIINIGSGSGISPRKGQVNYSSSKSAIIGFSRSLARELAPRGIRVLVVAPGFTATEMAQSVSQETRRSSLQMIPMGRWGAPEEISKVVGFLASDDAAYMTGQTIVVDGGRAAAEQDFGLGTETLWHSGG